MKRYLVGTRISLHALDAADLADNAPYFRWLDDLELDRFTGRSRFANSTFSHRSYAENAARNDSLVMLGIYDNESSRHIGNIALKELDWMNRRGFLGYIVGEKDFHRKGVATDAVMMFTLYAFQKLNLMRIYTTVSVDNIGSIAVLRKCGYVEEGLMRGHNLVGGRPSDVFVFGALASEWEPEKGFAARALYESAWF